VHNFYQRAERRKTRVSHSQASGVGDDDDMEVGRHVDRRVKEKKVVFKNLNLWILKIYRQKETGDHRLFLSIRKESVSFRDRFPIFFV